MVKASMINIFMQQLYALSLAELLEVRARVDVLIEQKSLPLGQGLQRFFHSAYNYTTFNTHNIGSYYRTTSVSNETREIDIAAAIRVTVPPSSLKGHLRHSIFSENIEQKNSSQYQIAQFSELEANGDDSLEKVIGLVDQWMADQSEYDEQTYPEIEAALDQNRMSV